MRVISASRRTDIAAFYSRWLLRRLREGWCEWVNPFSGARQRVSLRPEEVAAIVFWTRNPAPLFPHLDWLASGYRFYFHFTINGYPRELESHSPPVEAAVRTFRRLSERTGPGRVHWRYDPVLMGGRIDETWHLRQFEKLSRALEGSTARCYFSFATWYGKTKRNLTRIAKSGGEPLADPAAQTKVRLVSGLAAIAAARGITLYSCCDDDLAVPPVRRSSCVDPGLLEELSPGIARALTPAPTRPSCGCVASTDIGAYDTCLFGCEYCYATNSRKAALGRWRAHEPGGLALWAPVPRPPAPSCAPGAPALP
jgi:hypothetical protein